MFKVFDIHTHTSPEAISEKACVSLGKFYNFTVYGKGTYAHLESQAAENNVGGYLLFSVATNAHQVPKVNDSIAALVKKSRENGFETVGFAGMHQDFPDFEGEILRAKGMGLRGVKLHPDIQQSDVDDPIWFPLYDRMQEKNLLLYLHAGDNRPQYRFSEPGKIAHIARLFPRLRIVAAHLGGYSAWGEADCLYPLDNVFYDCSSALWAMTTEKANELVSQLGSDRIMFGTDYPVMHAENELKLFMKLSLTERERENIFYNNAKSFLTFSQPTKQ